MTTTPSILALMNRVLDETFGGSSWDAWRTVLSAAFGLNLSTDQLAQFRELTGRQHAPTTPVSELWLLLGRRSGKSIVAALVAIFFACVREYRVTPGEQLVIAVIAADRKQGRIIKSYVSGLLDTSLALRALRVGETADSITLTGVRVEIVTASHRVSRGYSYAAVICDEMAFWRSEESADPDRDVLNAVRPGMATVAGSMLIVLSSVYARRGETWRAYREHYGQDDDPTLVVNAPTPIMNPTISADVIAEAMRRDPVAAAAEWGATFRTDVESFVDLDTVDRATVSGRSVLAPVEGVSYVACLDAAGGSGRDSMTVAVAHVEEGVARLDIVREWRPPFSPDQATAEAAAVVLPYTTVVYADRYAGDWPVVAFAQHGISVGRCDRTKSELYLELLPLLNSHRVELLDSERLAQQLSGLERRTSRGGKDVVDHAVGGHDDVVNAAAGALIMAMRSVNHEKHIWGGDLDRSDDDEGAFRQRKAQELVDSVQTGAGWFPGDEGAAIGVRSRYWSNPASRFWK